MRKSCIYNLKNAHWDISWGFTDILIRKYNVNTTSDT